MMLSYCLFLIPPNLTIISVSGTTSTYSRSCLLVLESGKERYHVISLTRLGLEVHLRACVAEIFTINHHHDGNDT